MSDVVNFPTPDELPLNLLTATEQPWSGCVHDRINLDVHTRTVHCVICAKVLDPFSFLRDNADMLRRAWDNHRHVVARVREVSARLELLTKEKARLSGQVKRLQDKAGGIDVRGKDRL